MRKIRRMSWVVVASGLLIAAVSEGQPDASKALVGKWQGEVQYEGVGGDQNRTLIVKSVSQKDGKWIAEGSYGITGKGLGNVHIDVETGGKWLSIRFVTKANSTVRLDLLSEKSLVGTMTLAGSRQRGRDRAMKLEKVE